LPFANRDGVRVYFEAEGSGPPVLLLAGLSGIGSAWRPVVPLLSPRFQVIRPDHRGCGRSDRPADGYTIFDHARDMVSVLDHLGLERVAVVGSSTGGAIAQTMALDYPDRIDRLVLASSWARPDPFFVWQFDLRKRVLDELGPEQYTRLSALFLFSPRYLAQNHRAVDEWCSRAATVDRRILARRIDTILAFDESARLGRITCPILITVGEEDFCTPPHMSEELARAIPGAELSLLPGGHLVYMERPEAFARVVSDFLTS
jgi:aminoacrylate hydrolase